MGLRGPTVVTFRRWGGRCWGSASAEEGEAEANLVGRRGMKRATWKNCGEARTFWVARRPRLPPLQRLSVDTNYYSGRERTEVHCSLVERRADCVFLPDGCNTKEMLNHCIHPAPASHKGRNGSLRRTKCVGGGDKSKKVGSSR